jgi:lysophospholipase L1-like esterase
VIFAFSFSFAQLNTPRFETEIVAFEQADQENNPGDDIFLFIGSSSIRMWKSLNEDFADLNVLNRGFGGSETSDAILHFDRIIKPYSPEKILFYEGDNDLANGKTAVEVLEDFRHFIRLVEEILPETPVYFISIKPSPSRWNIHKEMERANQLIEELCTQKMNLKFIDIYSPMIGENGKPIPELFISDSLHMTNEGYKIWTKTIRPFVYE